MFGKSKYENENVHQTAIRKAMGSGWFEYYRWLSHLPQEQQERIFKVQVFLSWLEMVVVSFALIFGIVWVIDKFLW